jgi:hypothetical protein
MRLDTRYRVKIWKPVWGPEFEGWAKTFVDKNLWRVDPSLESFDDMMQDIFEVFLRLQYKYPRVVEARHFMALFKTSVKNMVCDKSRYKKRKTEATVTLPKDASEYAETLYGVSFNEGPLAVLLSELPVEIQKMIQCFDNEQLLEEMRKPIKLSRGKFSRRETLNERLCRIIGLDTKIDLAGWAKDLLS